MAFEFDMLSSVCDCANGVEGGHYLGDLVRHSGCLFGSDMGHDIRVMIQDDAACYRQIEARGFGFKPATQGFGQFG